MTYWNGASWEADRPADPPRRRRGRRFLGAAAEAGLITLLIFGLIAGTALGAKGGAGGGGSRSPAALVVTPNPVDAYGADYSVTGSGFKPNTAVNIVISMPTCCAFFTVTADAEGDVWFVYSTGAPGTYQIDANQRLNGRKLTLMATTTFEVAEP